MKNVAVKLIIIVAILFGYYLITNQFPPFYLLIIGVIFMGLGNTHLWGKTDPNRKSLIHRWYGTSNEEEKVEK